MRWLLVLLPLILIPMGIGNSFAGLPMLNHDFGVPFCMICPGRTILPLFTGDISQLAIDFSSKTKMVLTALGMVVTGFIPTSLSEVAEYWPTIPEVLISLGVWAIGFFLITIFYKIALSVRRELVR